MSDTPLDPTAVVFTRSHDEVLQAQTIEIPHASTDDRVAGLLHEAFVHLQHVHVFEEEDQQILADATDARAKVYAVMRWLMIEEARRKTTEGLVKEKHKWSLTVHNLEEGREEYERKNEE